MNRIPSLDGIRALSIGLVIVCHFMNDLGAGDPWEFGALGVRIFFVISGFLITTLLLNELAETDRIDLGRFYFRRTLRIFPPFYAYLFIMLGLSGFGWVYFTWLGSIPAFTYTSNYWMIWDQSYYVISNSWSLSTEEQFYLLWPFALKFAGKKGGQRALIAIVVLSPMIRTLVYFSNGGPTSALLAPHLNADHLATGCLLAYVHRTTHFRSLGNIEPSWIIGFFACLILAANGLANRPSIHRTFLPTAVNLSIALCILLAVRFETSFLGKCLNFKWLVWIGTLSYSLYLWQQPFLHLHQEHPALLLSGVGTVIAYPPVSLFMMLLCACLSHYGIERPSLRLRNWLERRPKHMALNDPISAEPLLTK